MSRIDRMTMEERVWQASHPQHARAVLRNGRKAQWCTFTDALFVSQHIAVIYDPNDTAFDYASRAQIQHPAGFAVLLAPLEMVTSLRSPSKYEALAFANYLAKIFDWSSVAWDYDLNGPRGPFAEATQAVKGALEYWKATGGRLGTTSQH